MNLVPDSLRQSVAKRLVDKLRPIHWRFGTGFLGTPTYRPLSSTPVTRCCVSTATQTAVSVVGILVDHGATTMWERWNGDQDVRRSHMNSYNHYGYGAVGAWIYRYAAGIDTDPGDPGFHTILLHPNFDKKLGSLDFSYESSYGTIHSAWAISGNKATWNLAIPANSTGRLPLTAAQEESFKLDGQPLSQCHKVHALSISGNAHGYELPSGTYQFEITLP